MMLIQDKIKRKHKEKELKALNEENTLIKIEQNENNDASTLIEESCYIYNSTNSNYEEENKINEEKKEYNKKNLNILEFIKIIGQHENTAEYIKEIGNEFFISGGTDDKIIIYTSDFNKMKEKIFFDWVYDILDLRNINKNPIDIIVCTKVAFHLIRINESRNKITCYDSIKGYSFCQQMNYGYYLICKKGASYLVSDLFSHILQIKSEIGFMNMIFNGGIIINDHYIALTSNSIKQSGKNILILYNNLTKKIVYEETGYSFLPSSNGLTVMSKNENKILLCACKKYLKYQKNGIFLVNINFDEERKININSLFYDTKDFEVYCFCQIFLSDKNSNRIFEEYKYKYETNYFLAGGYEKKKGLGKIKLFKIEDNKNFLDTEIEFIQDVEIEKKKKFKGFRGPISKIIQTKKTGKILLSCWDGNIYLFNPPNFDYLLFYDNINK